jgi:hypothetical protein
LARIQWTPEDDALVESILQQFDPRERLSDSRLRDLMPASDWDEYIEGARRNIRGEIVIALVAQTAAEHLFRAGVESNVMGGGQQAWDVYKALTHDLEAEWAPIFGRLGQSFKGKDSDLVANQLSDLRTLVTNSIFGVEWLDIKPEVLR